MSFPLPPTLLRFLPSSNTLWEGSDKNECLWNCMIYYLHWLNSEAVAYGTQILFPVDLILHKKIPSEIPPWTLCHSGETRTNVALAIITVFPRGGGAARGRLAGACPLPDQTWTLILTYLTFMVTRMEHFPQFFLWLLPSLCLFDKVSLICVVSNLSHFISINHGKFTLLKISEFHPWFSPLIDRVHATTIISRRKLSK